MIKEINVSIIVSILSAIVYIVFGVIMILNPHIAINVIATCFGVIVGIIGLAFILKYLLDKNKYEYSGFGFTVGIIFVILALLLFFKFEQLAMLIPIVLGILIIINGAKKTEYIIALRKKVNSNWLMLLVLGLVEIVLGIVLIFNPFESSLALTQIIGIFIIAYSVVDIIECVMLKMEIGKVKKIMQQEIEE